MNRFTTAVWILGGSLLVATSAFATGTTRVVAIEGQAPPDGFGTFLELGRSNNFFDRHGPVLSDNGYAVFAASILDPANANDPFLFSSDTGIFASNGTGPIIKMVRVGDPSPDGLGAITSTDIFFPVNSSGQIGAYHRTDYEPNPNFSGNQILTTGLPNTAILRENELVPGPGGGMYRTTSIGFNTINNAGQQAFNASFRRIDQVGTTNVWHGVFRSDSQGNRTTIARSYETPPGGGIFRDFSIGGMNESGFVAFAADISPQNGHGGVFAGDGSTIIEYARRGAPRPDGGTFGYIYGGPQINNAGQIAFKTSETYIPYQLTGEIIWLADLSGGFNKIAEEGDVPVGGGGQSFSRLLSIVPQINDAGQVAFRGTFGNYDTLGIFRGDGSGPAETILLSGDPMPDGNGTIAAGLMYSDPVAMNNAGQIATNVLIDVVGGTDRGIVFYDDATGPVVVAREGQELFGSTINKVQFQHYHGSSAQRYSGLNNAGQVGYWFELDDGREGIAIWSPDTLAMLGDLNGDSALTDADIASFVQALTDPGGFAATYPGIDVNIVADFNGDGLLTNSDIGGFIDALNTAGIDSSAVPEPTALAILGIAGLLITRRRR